jgi:hypothetical protein
MVELAGFFYYQCHRKFRLQAFSLGLVLDRSLLVIGMDNCSLFVYIGGIK